VNRYKVTFLPDQKEVEVDEGATYSKQRKQQGYTSIVYAAEGATRTPDTRFRKRKTGNSSHSNRVKPSILISATSISLCLVI